MLLRLLKNLFKIITLGEAMAILDASKPNEDQAKLLVGGMENLVGLLGSVLSGLGGREALGWCADKRMNAVVINPQDATTATSHFTFSWLPSCRQRLS